MKKLLKIIAVLLLIPSIVFAKEEDKLFIYSDLAYENLTGVASDKDGNYAVVGGKYQYERMFAFIVKYDKNDKILWERTVSDEVDLYDIEATDDGGFVAVGDIYFGADLDENLFMPSGLIIKYDKDGNKVWHTYIDRSDFTWLYDVEIASDGTIYAVGMSGVGGESSAPIIGWSQAVIAKVDKDGKKLNQITFDYNNDEEFNSITLTKDGGFIVSGFTDSSDIKGVENLDENKLPIVVKYNKDDIVEWTNYISPSPTLENGSDCRLSDYNDSEFYEVIETKDGGYIGVGAIVENVYGFYPESDTMQGNIEVSYGVIVKYDKDGKQLWMKKYDNEAHSFFTDVEEDEDGKLYVSGYFGQSTQISETRVCNSDPRYFDALLVTYDKDGNIEEEKKYSGNKDEKLDDIELPKDGGSISVGLIASTDLPEVTPVDEVDGLIVKVYPEEKEEDILPGGNTNTNDNNKEDEKVENPKTGVASYTSILLFVAIIAFIIRRNISKKEVFKGL